MLCFFVRRLVQAYLGDALRARDVERLRRHCERCAPCAAAVRQAEETARLVASLPRRSLSGDEAGALLARVRLRGRERLGERLLGTPAPLPTLEKPLAVRAAERWDALKHEATLLGFRVFARPVALPACAAVPVAALLLVMLHRGTPTPSSVSPLGEVQDGVAMRREAAPPPAAGAAEPGTPGALRPPAAPAPRDTPVEMEKAAAPAMPALGAPPGSASRVAVTDADVSGKARARGSAPAPVPQPLKPAATPTAPGTAPRRAPSTPVREVVVADAVPGVLDGATGARPRAPRPDAAPLPPPAPEAVTFGGERGIPPVPAAATAEAPGEPGTREVPAAPATARAVPDATPAPTAERALPGAAPPAALEAAGGGGGMAGAPGRPAEHPPEGMAGGGVARPQMRAIPPAAPGGPGPESARSRSTETAPAPGAQRTHSPAQVAKVPADAAAQKAGTLSQRKDPRMASKPRGELIRLLGGKTDEAQGAARELGRRGEKRAVEALGRLLRTHAEKEVREAAADALSAIGTREALAILRGVAEGDTPGKEAAARALERRR